MGILLLSIMVALTTTAVCALQGMGVFLLLGIYVGSGMLTTTLLAAFVLARGALQRPGMPNTGHSPTQLPG
ncbi:hypothetical protein CLV78_104291 [Aliiruegeria haliotis]|uniref:Uncharacterized protein n=1 Tax=Aliiruegeria haliotis TaxID=1280846 RepID=A0A2T0RRJ8_9RHOB|nr:hypothetical protein [Aliiruegeria haliotis]PRY23798.1 hypothetical protein CLV78_104291 [Aliiruegeria haliotis]